MYSNIYPVVQRTLCLKKTKTPGPERSLRKAEAHALHAGGLHLILQSNKEHSSEH